MWDHYAIPKVKPLAPSAIFSPIANSLLEISSPEFALKDQFMLTSNIHKEWETTVFSCIKGRNPLKKISILPTL